MIHTTINGLIQQAAHAGLIQPFDRNYVRNRIYSMLEVEPIHVNTFSIDESIPDLLDKIVNFAVNERVINQTFDCKEVFTANIMNCFVARPSAINEIFQEKYKNSPKKATDYFYELSKNSNYIQMNRIRNNISFKTDTFYGEMDITINMSKPEKDPEQIKKDKETDCDLYYPKCVLCVENEGYEGRAGYPARSNHRLIRVPLGKETWYMQYSPYVYYNEHSILIAEDHRPMTINKSTFEKLLGFVVQFPHYFIGSNADLPIVGGSILSHEHFQAGRYTFPMTNADTAFSFQLGKFPEVSASMLNWPLAVIRLQSSTIDKLVLAADQVLTAWISYEDEKEGIKAFTGKTRHNTVTPIARMRDDLFELDLILRNNRTSDEHPLGIFHPHADVHHIKKENIGLIEVMGLAVLPSRLKSELEEIQKYLQDETCDIAAYHKDWAEDVKARNPAPISQQQAISILKTELGNKFSKALEDSGVFKTEMASKRFIKYLKSR